MIDDGVDASVTDKSLFNSSLFLRETDIDLVESLFVTLWTLQMGRVTGEVRRRWSGMLKSV